MEKSKCAECEGVDDQLFVLCPICLTKACARCWINNVRITLRSGKENVKCLCPACPLLLMEDRMLRFMMLYCKDHGIMEEYRRTVFKRFIMEAKLAEILLPLTEGEMIGYRYCPACKLANMRWDEASCKISCMNCEYEFCWKCGSGWFDGHMSAAHPINKLTKVHMARLARHMDTWLSSANCDWDDSPRL